MMSRSGEGKKNRDSTEPIAIVGIGLRLPGGCVDVESYWKFLLEGRDAIREIPKNRFDIDAFYARDGRAGSIRIRVGGFLEPYRSDGPGGAGESSALDPWSQFDPGFFEISPREARTMDPQQRILLETTVEAFDDAGIPLESLRGSKTGVYVGIAGSEYGDVQQASSERRNINSTTNSGAALSIAANRLSYVFDLRGPSFAVDTACSSSLTAAHLACEDLRRGATTAALLGGVNFLLNPEPYIGFSIGEFLSVDGRCQAFDRRANGYVRSEGGGVLILKRLSDAVRDGNRIYACIHGSHINQDGKSDGISAPSVDAQKAMLSDAYARFGISPDRVGYVEAHGTGTQIGDRVETQAIGEVLAQCNRTEPLWIGSVKTNIGHLEAASGIAGLIKAALVVKNQVLPQNLHFREPNPDIDFRRLNLRVPIAPVSLSQNGERPFVGVNSFGFGGSNAHVILGPPLIDASARPEASVREADPVFRSAPFMRLSAPTEPSLRNLAEKYYRELKRAASDRGPDGRATRDRGPDKFADFAASTLRHRSRYRCGLDLWAKSSDEALSGLHEYLAHGSDGNVEDRQVWQGAGRSATNPKLVFVYSGMGTQWWAMARELLEHDRLFRADMTEISDRLSSMGWDASTGRSLIDEMLESEEKSQIHSTRVAQAAIMALQVAMTKKLRRWGLAPQAVVGHSVGEVAAAWASGAFDLEQAVNLIGVRSQMQHRAEGQGLMIATELSRQDAERTVSESYRGRLCVAALNSPTSTVISGNTDAIQDLAKRLDARGLFHRVLDVRVPYHSHAMEPLQSSFLKGVASLRPRATEVPFFSTVTGGQCKGEDLSPDYWYRNMREPVLFAQAIAEIAKTGDCVFIEVCSHPALSNHIFNTVSGGAKVLSTLSKKRPALRQMSQFAAELTRFGVRVDAAAFCGDRPHDPSLPRPDFERQSFWLESSRHLRKRTETASHPHVTGPFRGPGADSDVGFEITLDPLVTPSIKDHRVQGEIVYPAAGMVELAVEAGRRFFKDMPFDVESFEIDRAIFIPESGLNLRLSLSPLDGRFVLFSDELEQTTYARGVYTRTVFSGTKRIRVEPGSTVDIDGIYRAFDRAGLNYGPCFQVIKSAAVSDSGTWVRIEVPDLIQSDLQADTVHPAILDGAFQAVISTLGTIDKIPAYLPTSIDRIVIGKCSRESRYWARVELKKNAGSIIAADIDLYPGAAETAECAPILSVHGFKAKALETSSGLPSLDGALFMWKWIESDGPFQLSESRRSRLYSLSERSAVLASEFSEQQGTVGVKNLAQMDAVMPPYNDLTSLFVIREIGRTAPGFLNAAPISIEGLLKRTSVSHPKGKLLLTKLMTDLVAAGWANEAAGQYRVSREWTEDSLGLAIDEKVRVLRDFGAVAKTDLSLLLKGAGNLSRVLEGNLDPVGLFFSEESHDEMQEFYTKGLNCGVYCDLSSRLLAILIDKSDDKPIRILELGAGTGGFTASLLRELSGKNIEYVFSDISSGFFEKAREKFRQYSRVTFQTLDLEKDPVEQGFFPHSFDFVVAFDVIHATRDIAKTLRSVRRLMKINGKFLMLEITRPSPAFFATFGLLDGCWHFTDHEIRTSDPLVDESGWLKLLRSAGFVSLQKLNLHERGWQTIYLAEVEALDPEAAADLDLELKARTEACGRGHWFVLGSPGEQKSRIEKCLRESGIAPSDDLTGLPAALSAASSTNPLTSEECHVVFALPKVLTQQADAMECVDATLKQVLALAKKLDATERPYRVTLVAETEAVAGTECRSLVSSAVNGFRRAWANESPQAELRQIDYSRETDDMALLSEIIPPLRHQIQIEDEVMLLGHRRLVPRFHPLEGLAELSREGRMQLPVLGTSFGLEGDDFGSLDSLVLRKQPRQQVGSEQVRIEVHKVGLNFRDLLIATGMISRAALAKDELEPALGLECGGIVTEVGALVTQFRVGDSVIAIPYFSTISGEVVIDSDLLAKKPEGMSLSAAANMVTYLTSYYALLDLARIQRGESVLIHSGTGGVGLSAIAIARAVGAKIFATAGSESKRDYLRKIGVQFVYDSRSPAFHREILRDTDGAGVDVVLNSLAGPYIWESLTLLKDFGRFLELGKMDMYRNSRIGLAPYLRNLSYFGVDLAQLRIKRRERSARLTEETLAFLQRNRIEPMPMLEFPVSRFKEAFRQFAKGEHIGKFILDFESDGHIELLPSRHLKFSSSKSTYVIAGGTSGFGLATAEWLARQGVTHVVLLSRSGVKYDEDRARLDEMSKTGVHIAVENVDVTSFDQVRDALVRAKENLPPIRGVIHTAMVLHDVSIQNMSDEQMTDVLKPKLKGLLNLHRAVADLALELDQFVCFSSGTMDFGNPGQANYTAANAAMETLMVQRRAAGKPGLCISWGMIGQVGYVARMKDHRLNDSWEEIPLQMALQVLEQSFLSRPSQLSVIKLNWAEVSDMNSGMRKSLRYAEVLSRSDGRATAKTGGRLAQSLLAMSASAAATELSRALVSVLGQIVGSGLDRIDPAASILALGLDSLSANQLRGWIMREFDYDLPLMRVMKGPTVQELAADLVDILKRREPLATTSAQMPTDWLTVLSGTDRASNRLFCFPEVLGTTHGFGALVKAIERRVAADKIEICAVRIPGFPDRPTEPYIESTDVLATKIADAIEPLLDRPSAFFGCSYGTLLGYEVARVLSERGKTLDHFFIVSMSSPGDAESLALFTQHSVHRIQDELAEIASAGLLKSFNPGDPAAESLLRTAHVAVDSLLRRGRVVDWKLPGDVTCFYGFEDKVLRRAQVDAWRDVVAPNRHFKLQENPGGHLFYLDDPDAIAVEIVDWTKKS